MLEKDKYLHGPEVLYDYAPGQLFKYIMHEIMYY